LCFSIFFFNAVPIKFIITKVKQTHFNKIYKVSFKFSLFKKNAVLFCFSMSHLLRTFANILHATYSMKKTGHSIKNCFVAKKLTTWTTMYVHIMQDIIRYHTLEFFKRKINNSQQLRQTNIKAIQHQLRLGIIALVTW
jgi:hypothetical protein